MNLQSAMRISLALALAVGILAWSSDTGKPTTVKGYVLDSAWCSNGADRPRS